MPAYGHDGYGYEHARDAGGTQSQIQASIIKSNADAEKFAVQTLLGIPSTANLAPGVGNNLNVTA